MGVRKLAAFAFMSAYSVIGAHGQPGLTFPAKVTLLLDVELPIPFSVTDAVQPVKAGSEVSVIKKADDSIKISYGLGEGFVPFSHTDFAEQAKQMEHNPPMPIAIAAPTATPKKKPSTSRWMTREQYDKRQSDLAEMRKAEQERQREEAERKRQQDIDRKKAEERIKIEEETQKLEEKRQKLEQERIAAQRQALSAQTAALDAQILAAQQTVFRLRGALIGPDAGVKIGRNGIRDVRERSYMQRELATAERLLINLQNARAQSPSW